MRSQKPRPCARRTLCGSTAIAMLSVAWHPTAFAITDHFEKCNVLDPEFNTTIDMMVHQRILTGPPRQEVVVQYVDKANDGALLAEQTLSSGEISNYGASQAGPKFAVGDDENGNDENYIVWTKVSNTEFQVRLRRYHVGTTGCSYGNSFPKNCFPDTQDDASTIPLGAPPTDVSRFTVYSTEDEAYAYRAKVVYRYTDTSGRAPIFNYASPISFSGCPAARRRRRSTAMPATVNGHDCMSCEGLRAY